MQFSSSLQLCLDRNDLACADGSNDADAVRAAPDETFKSGKAEVAETTASGTTAAAAETTGSGTAAAAFLFLLPLAAPGPRLGRRTILKAGIAATDCAFL